MNLGFVNPQDPHAVRRAFQTLQEQLGFGSNALFAGLTLTGLTASRLIWANASKALASKDLVDLVAGTANRVTVADDAAGGIVISGPQDIDTGASVIFADATLSAPSNIYALSHDSFADFVADEHFLQTAITNVSTALSTGLLKVTTGTGALSVVTDSSANWDIAYTHSQLTSGNPHNVSASDVGLGNVENTALSTWAGSANIVTVGTIVTGTWNADTIGISKGGTGQTAQQAAIDALTNVSAATNEYVLTKDTASGNALWKVAAGGVDTSGTPVANDFARFTDADTIEGRSYAETLSDLSGQATSAFDLNGQDLTNGGVLFLTEQGSAEADVAGKGQFWVKTATPNVGMFTDDAGTDVEISTSILGDGTANRVLRLIELTIEDGTDANTLKCTVTSVWNGDAIGATDNISKSATTGNFYLTASGAGLRILATGLTGDPIMAFNNLSYNDASSSYNPIFTTSKIESEPSIEVSARLGADGQAIDWTALVDDASHVFTKMYILYITDA